MTTKNTHRECLLPGLAIVAALGMAVIGCKSTSGGMASAPKVHSDSAARAEPDGAKVWAENCGRCHNLRSPDEFSGDQWQVIVHHMRIRATLTAEETRAVVQFLKAAN